MRISVTDLDQYQIWLEMEDVGPEWLIDRLTKFEPSPAMRAGSAFHKLMENVGLPQAITWDDLARMYDSRHAGRKARTLPMEAVADWAEKSGLFDIRGDVFFERGAKPAESVELVRGTADGFYFKFDVNAEISVPAVREMKIERLVLPEIVLVGKIDGIQGQTIIDYKLTKTLDIERYTDSYQWRAYLMLFESRIFRYDIFEGSPDRGKELDYTIHAYHPLKFYAYDGMREDVLRCVSNLAEFIQKHNITTKLVTSESMD